MFWLASFLRVLRLCSREECRESQVAFSRKEEKSNETVFCNRYDWSIVWSCDPDHVKAKQETPFPILKERTRGGKKYFSKVINQAVLYVKLLTRLQIV